MLYTAWAGVSSEAPLSQVQELIEESKWVDPANHLNGCTGYACTPCLQGFRPEKIMAGLLEGAGCAGSNRIHFRKHQTLHDPSQEKLLSKLYRLS